MEDYECDIKDNTVGFERKSAAEKEKPSSDQAVFQAQEQLYFVRKIM